MPERRRCQVKIPLKAGQTPPSGLEKPFRRNGTWIDVGIWSNREDIISLDPFRFTLAAGRSPSTRSIVDVKSGLKLAYTQGNISLPVNFGSLSAFILTDAKNTKYQVVDSWTIGPKDEHGRVLLGIERPNGDTGGSWQGGTEWAGQGCAWTGKNLCDGNYFLNCKGCFGIPAVLEVVECTKT